MTGRALRLPRLALSHRMHPHAHLPTEGRGEEGRGRAQAQGGPGALSAGDGAAHRIPQQARAVRPRAVVVSLRGVCVCVCVCELLFRSAT